MAVLKCCTKWSENESDFCPFLKKNQHRDTDLGKYINLIGRILRVLNIEHILHAMPYAVVFDNILIFPYVDKGGFVVIFVMTVELSTFIGYT